MISEKNKQSVFQHFMKYYSSTQVEKILLVTVEGKKILYFNINKLYIIQGNNENYSPE